MTATTESHAYAELVKPDTNNATFIGWSEWEDDSDWPTDYYPLNKKEFYKLLDQMNQGLNNGYRTNRPYQTYRMNRDLAATLSDKLRMTQSQRLRAIRTFTKLDLQRLGFPVQVVPFCVCAYVVHEEGKGRKCHPACNNIDALFTQMREELNIREDKFSKVYGKVENRIRTGKLDSTDFDEYQLDKALRFTWQTSDADTDDGWL